MFGTLVFNSCHFELYLPTHICGLQCTNCTFDIPYDWYFLLKSYMIRSYIL